MVENSGVRGFRVVFVPRHVHARVALHSLATATGAIAAVRMGAGNPWWAWLAWYAACFIGAHVVMVPFMAAWYMATDRIARWVRGLVEEELIRFDLQTYDRQLKRVLSSPAAPLAEPPPESSRPRSG